MSKRTKDTAFLLFKENETIKFNRKSKSPLWKEQLKERGNVDYRLYPKLNHFFTEGDGEISKPDEYYVLLISPSML